jgi:hypothetical protein
MRKNEALRLYSMRIRLAALLNILDVVGVVSSLIKQSETARAKLRKQTYFRNLLFALDARCMRLLEGISYHAEGRGKEHKLSEIELIKIAEFIHSSKRELVQSQELLEKYSISEALEKLEKAKVGLAELAEMIDHEFQEWMR